jgi:hypothetical protein
MTKVHRSTTGCPYQAQDRAATVVARDVDDAGKVHFVYLRPYGGGPTRKYAVDASGKILDPPLDP